ncbi:MULTISPECIES: KEOPS complex subunit Pcc1 [Salinibaculum]|uniref:KEOPS complex subunit Pcc1 n=1 Tax=Salinibaculum TaxID=2732368 RepID=UPI0030CE7B81
MRRARITTTHGNADAAAAIAAAVRPDDTAEMDTRSDEERVVTMIERETTGGLHATVDDYVVNLTVAAQLSDQDGETSTDDTQS